MVDERGVTDFDRLRSALARGGLRAAFLYAFDLIELNGTDLRPQPWIGRREALASLLSKARNGTALSEHVVGPHGAEVYAAAFRMGLEGIVSKRVDRPYRSGRCADWAKVRNLEAPAASRAIEHRWKDHMTPNAETNLVFTFEDQATGSSRSILAPNEAAARLLLGGNWIDKERTPGRAPNRIEDLAELLKEAQAAERAAHQAYLDANPIRRTRIATAEILGRINALAEKQRQAQAWVQELIRISVVTHR